MDQNTELLNQIYQNTQMGIKSIEKLNDIVEDKAVLDHLSKQYTEYQEIKNKAHEMLKERGNDEKGISQLAKISSSVSVKLNTMIDKTPSHIADMMIKGSTMGVIQATKNNNKYQNADKEVISLNQKLLNTEKSNIEEFKKFL